MSSNMDLEPELRKDLMVNRWVLISPARGKRPHDYNKSSISMSLRAGPCAFCYDHEQETGRELFAIPNEGDGAPRWRVRVVENIYPAVSTTLDPEARPATVDAVEETYLTGCSMAGFGSHEVVIETPYHDQLFTALPVEHMADILKAYQSRIEALRKDKRFKYCQIFKNHGNAAGASMVHSHSQIISLAVVPRDVEDEVEGSRIFFERNKLCIFCAGMDFDLNRAGKVRVIDETPMYVSVSPFAARFPFETWILPRRHTSNFGSVTAEEVLGLAEILKMTLMKMNRVLNFPPFNFMLLTAPLHNCDVAYYHWYLRIVPHLVSLGGFELGGGCHINPVSPEFAAESIRNAEVAEEALVKPSNTNDNHC